MDESFLSGRNYQGQTNSSNDNYTKNLTRALQLQTGLFVLENSLTTYEDAKKFLEQAVVQGDAIQLSQVMREEACDALETRILTDDTLSNVTEQEMEN